MPALTPDGNYIRPAYPYEPEGIPDPWLAISTAGGATPTQAGTPIPYAPPPSAAPTTPAPPATPGAGQAPNVPPSPGMAGQPVGPGYTRSSSRYLQDMLFGTNLTGGGGSDYIEELLKQLQGSRPGTSVFTPNGLNDFAGGFSVSGAPSSSGGAGTGSIGSSGGSFGGFGGFLGGLFGLLGR